MIDKKIISIILIVFAITLFFLSIVVRTHPEGNENDPVTYSVSEQYMRSDYI